MMLETVNELTVGQVFKSYTELCKYLDVTAKRSGKPKDEQIEEFNRYFTFKMFSDNTLMIDSIVGKEVPKKPLIELLATNLEIGKEYTYSQFCKILHEKTEHIGSVAFELQCRNWRRIMDFEGKYVNGIVMIIVSEIYDTPIEITSHISVVRPKGKCYSWLKKNNETILQEHLNKLQHGMTFERIDSLVQFLQLRLTDRDSWLNSIPQLIFKYVEYDITKDGQIVIDKVREEPLKDNEVFRMLNEKTNRRCAKISTTLDSLLYKVDGTAEVYVYSVGM